ncbi:MAG: hypothetical protein UR17_C0001G0869 [Candidatus Woesebacteria bacterium GW2011_GWF1_31_35]|uniref:Uncharacterized protein n=1 Tax=Candidatus Woesebacteria bacterium GW2011_GWC2_31_9 TaxID=1618586 RepID=A0A0G0BLD4_9BACT|nr:MAG: hypothetical protein UR17_C0001G0869 [Candidatus Woesebacteria bacterium GW2011_GWF1_31_35]KKP23589.1 MAG: hypothetical protein UR11_C0001G0563 [Candidatus Woesebacteria bacterium GW2011_GWC1_30_29]KKP27030.1 MAG: hypothetical protein UR13_C0001G0125 [Candidatus Woesebacteria bacterium GW2011_GWD1_31_12]KKP27864.1 MAG: hypothetical protein UR16_C0002G0194 [Candidatus Woesebacteria bacterium GW2011_GWB1_31_29]KKP31867.1 MAG: hypothetical protein UR21_C0004G0003 [Candidatus Woesebacteria 
MKRSELEISEHSKIACRIGRMLINEGIENGKSDTKKMGLRRITEGLIQ